MHDEIAAEILRDQSQMESDRAPWESHWTEIARRVLPRQDEFNGQRPQGARRTQGIYDSTAQLALDRFAAAIEGMTVPRAQIWHRLAPSERTLAKNVRVRRWFEEVTQILFDYRYASTANFATQFHETIMSLGAFGTAPLWIEEWVGRGLVYKSVHIREIFIAENFRGSIDKVHRKFELTARAAVQKWGVDKLPERIVTAAKDRPETKFTFLHALMPRADVDPARADHKGMPIASYYVAIDDRRVIDEGGYHTFPLPVARYVTSPRETYGRSPAMMVLPDIKMAQEQAKDILEAGQKALRPPLLVPDDGVLTKIQTRANGINIGGLDNRGNPLVVPLQTGGSLPVGMEMLEASRKVINDAFLVTLFEIMVDAPDRMTATEVMERVQEKGVLLAPAVGRIENELLGPMIERELDILTRSNRLPPMPEELIEAEGEYSIVYENPLSRAARTEQASGFFRYVEGALPLAQYMPGLFDALDEEVIGRELPEIMGVPARWLADEKASQAKKDARQQQVDTADAVAAAPVIGDVAMKLAKAEEAAGAAVA